VSTDRFGRDGTHVGSPGGWLTAGPQSSPA